MPDLTPGVVSIVVPPLTGGTGVFETPDYSVEILAITAEMKTIGTALAATAASLGDVALQLAEIKAFLFAVQSATGDFRTLSPGDVASEAIVTSALAKNVPPIVPAAGVTS